MENSMEIPSGNIGDPIHESRDSSSPTGPQKPFEPYVHETVPERAFSFAQTLSFWYVKLFLVLSSLSLVILSSMIFYWLVYFLLIPPKLYTYPAHIRGDCLNVTLANRQWVSDFRPVSWNRPAASVEFDVSLMMQLPIVSSLENRNQSIIIASMLTASGNKLAEFQSQWLPPQLSNIALLLRNFAYAVPTALGLVFESWEAEIPLFSSFPLLVEEASDPLSYVQVCMQPRPDFYHSELRFHSKLSGLRYLLSTYPVGSFLIFTTVTTGLFTAFAASVGAVLLLVNNLRKKDDSIHIESDKDSESSE